MKKTVLITGASKGIGKETALLLAKEGYDLILTYNSDKKGILEVEKSCKDLGSKVHVFALDVRDEKSIRKLHAGVISKVKKISVLVNNAGIVVWKPFGEQDMDDITSQIETNLSGLLKVTMLFLPNVEDAIINVSSGAGKEVYSSLSVYCATKFAVRGFTQALAMEHPKLRVYSVNPDMTATQMTRFQGRPAGDIAKLILNTIKGMYKVKSGGDIDAWKLLG